LDVKERRAPIDRCDEQDFEDVPTMDDGDDGHGKVKWGDDLMIPNTQTIIIASYGLKTALAGHGPRVGMDWPTWDL
jgi:hypothetical protein